MSVSGLVLQPVTEEVLPQVACLHRKAFPGSALTLLGCEASRRYYHWQLHGPHDHVFAAAYLGRRMCGYAIGGVSRGAMSGFVKRHRMFLCLTAIMTPSLLFSQQLRGRLSLGLGVLMGCTQHSAPTGAKHTGRSFGVLAIGVEPESQGMGIGRALMNHLESVALKGGFTRMHLTVSAENKKAIRFYESLGWSREEGEGGWRGYMWRTLS